MNTEATRHYKVIEKQFGEETTSKFYGLVKEVSKETATLIISEKMEHFATNEHLTKVSHGLKSEIASSKTELKLEIAELRTELKLEIAELRTDLKLEIAELRTEIKVDITELKAELRHDANINLRWTILLWIAQLGALAGIIKYLAH